MADDNAITQLESIDQRLRSLHISMMWSEYRELSHRPAALDALLIRRRKALASLLAKVIESDEGALVDRPY